MKKIDKLVLKSFLGPFFLTFVVVVFILMMQNLLKYFDDLVGKGIGWEVFAEFLLYFAVYMTPYAVPLAVLLSSLMAFGNLGEHSELTAIKGAGISLVRSMRAIFVFVLIVTGVTFYSNNYIAPKTALKAYALLYDIKQKKPALDLKQGTFYGGMKNFSIKVNKKYPDGKTLKDLVIYDHSDGQGNVEVIVADSGMMYTVLNDRYLKMELFDGYYYLEGSSADPNKQKLNRSKISPYSRTKFAKSEIMFDLSEFNLKRTDEGLFSNDRLVRNLNQLFYDIDSIKKEILEGRYDMVSHSRSYFTYHLKEYTMEMPEDLRHVPETRDSVAAAQAGVTVSDNKKVPERLPLDTATATKKERKNILPKKPVMSFPADRAPKHSARPGRLVSNNNKFKVDSSLDWNYIEKLEKDLEKNKTDKGILMSALNRARNYKSKLGSQAYQIKHDVDNYYVFGVELQKRTAQAVSCLIMFLIGAPLGAIIKRGGLGVPVLTSISFFIIFYILTINGAKWAKEETLTITQGVWLPNAVLLPLGLFFLFQARVDARFFELDFYYVLVSKIRKNITKVYKS